MAYVDFRGTPTYFVVFKMMISSKIENQNMLKIPYSFEKICQALEVSPPDPSWPPAAGGFTPDPLPSPVRSYPHLLYCYKMF